MAVDEFLFESLDENPATYLRFYMWKRPTASLGYSQKATKVLDVDQCKKNGIDIVRRMTGGKLVLHHNEVTYSVSSSDSDLFTTTLSDSYRFISEALIQGFKKMGLGAALAEAPPSFYAKSDLPCFSYPASNEIKVGEKKIVGSAQKRVGSKFLQHGSIPMIEDKLLLKSITFLENENDDVRMTSISRSLGREVDFDWIVEHLASGFGEYFGVRLIEKELDKKAKKSIYSLQKEKYENPDWTFRTENSNR
jgi:lipoate-protein ligase A